LLTHWRKSTLARLEKLERLSLDDTPITLSMDSYLNPDAEDDSDNDSGSEGSNSAGNESSWDCSNVIPLSRLVSLELRRVDYDGNRLSDIAKFFSPTHLPTLRHLHLSMEYFEGDGPGATEWWALLPQLHHLEVSGWQMEDTIAQLHNAVALKRLRITLDSEDSMEDSIKSLEKLHLEELYFRAGRYASRIPPSADELTSEELEECRAMIEMITASETLKIVAFAFGSDLEKEELFRKMTGWEGIMDELRQACQKKGIQYVEF
jgi:hypothetical protein